MHAHPTYNAVEEQTTILQHAVSHNRILECVTAGEILALGMNSRKKIQISIQTDRLKFLTPLPMNTATFSVGPIEFEIELSSNMNDSDCISWGSSFPNRHFWTVHGSWFGNALGQGSNELGTWPGTI